MEDRTEDIITIDFKELFRVLWAEKWWIVLITSLFTAGGAYYAFTAREEFVSTGKILPEIQSKGGGIGQFSGLAALAGVDLSSVGGSGTDAIRPDLYPDVINSTPFFLSLFDQKFQTKNGDSLDFEAFYHLSIEEDKQPKDDKLQLPKARPQGILVVNELTEERLKDLKNRISGSIDKKSGLITISAKMPDPVIAAQVAGYAMNYLTSYVTDYRTEKLRQEVDFLGRKVASARGEFYKDQARKASYADQYSAPTMRLQAADIQRERLESEYKLSSNLYNELLKKYEESKIKLQQETPVYQILDPPVVPNLKSEPKKALIVLLSMFVGIISAFTFALIRGKNFKLIIH